MRRRAFTLIELLVVIAIIAILAAILFPVFAQARDNGRKATCLSNVKQLAMAGLMYAGDYDEKIVSNRWNPHNPTGVSYWPVWLDLLQPYIKNDGVGNCLNANNPNPGDFPGHIDYGAYTRYVNTPPSNHYRIPYGMPETLGLYPDLAAGHYAVKKLAEIAEPATRLQMAEAVKYALKDPWQAPLQYGHVALRHGTGVVVGFMDGHAKVVPWRPLLQDCKYWMNVGAGIPGTVNSVCQ